ncbi:MAG TPA: SDR family NAD(P)-dependent oxidoreductase [Myxococcota bacterium]|nr:SDR family NAD(P)-dependent oxidoreductase [Myxococcota bacterium]
MSGSGKVVLVTGASGGVGRGIALACAEAGWTVWVAARRAREGSEVAENVDAVGGRGRYVACDVRDATSVASAVQAVTLRDGRLDGVVHNATSELSPRPVRLVEVPLADLREHAAVSVRGTWLLARSAFPHLRAARGSLLLLTSEAGFEGKARLAPYAAVKAMQRGLARALAREWGPHGVRVNGLAPLASSPAMERAFAEDAAMRARVLGRNPLGRLGDPVREIGAAARFLLSDDAAYVTGHTLMVDGGSCPVT